MKKRKRVILQTILLIILLFSLSHLILQITDTYHTYQTEQKLKQYEKEEKKQVLQTLKEENSDIVGWIQIKDTKINYPIVQRKDNEYYLTHDFKKRKNQAGWIFMDYRNQNDFSNYNTILYGHGRIDGTMFGTLKKLLQEDWWKEENHQIITTISFHTKITWQIFSVYTIPAESYYLNTYFTNRKSYKKFLTTIQNRSIYSFQVTLSTEDQILTLSTCKNEQNERIVVHAKKIKEESLM